MKTRACCTFWGWRSDFNVHRGHYLDALNFLSGKSWNSYLVLKIWKPYVVRIYPRSTFLLIPCEGWERRQNSRAKNYDESKSASMRPIHAVLLWDFGGFGV